MKLGPNLLAGLTNSIWSAVVGLAVVPFYLRYLGVEAYGLIGVFVTLQSLLGILDLGMAPTINREVARCSAAGNMREAGGVLHTLAAVYWGVAVTIALLMALLAPWIAEHWLQSRQLTAETVSHAVMMMGLVVAARWPVGLYQGALIGAQRLTLSSTINIFMVTVAALGAIAILALVAPTIEAFFAWQTGIGLLYAAVMRAAAWRIVGGGGARQFDWRTLRGVWRFTAGMGAIALSGLVFTQLDKIILSKILDLESFGQYMLATVVVSGLYVLINPVFNVIYPRMSALVAVGGVEELERLYRVGTRALASVFFPLTMILVVCAQPLVKLWTGNAHVASSVAPLIALLAAGSALHGVMYFPYALQLAYGRIGLALRINTVLMLVQLPLMVLWTIKSGAVGGAASWLMLHVMYVLLGTWLTHRSLLKGRGAVWLLQDVGVPLALAFGAGGLAYYNQQTHADGAFLQLSIVALLALAAAIVSVLSSSELRVILLRRWGRNGTIAK